jgi:hypothetical protein
MALKFDDLKQLLEQEGLHYYIDPKQEAVMLRVAALFGSYQLVISLQVEGQFLQFRSIGYLQCAPTHPHLAVVLRALCEINYQKRLVKLGWDARDGEIAAYADVWIMDGMLSQGQFHRMFTNFVPTLDESLPRLQEILQTGKDPGDRDLQRLLEAAARAGTLSEAARELLDDLQRQGPTGEPPEVGEI